MQVQCEGRVFDVHRAVVCMKSPVIARAVDGEFKVCCLGLPWGKSLLTSERRV